MPDLYQGTDDWDFSLVDPDNRRPVDFARRRKTLGAQDVLTSLGRWREGGLKQAIIARALALRRILPEVFLSGTYEPVTSEGPMAHHVVAFIRRHSSDIALTVVPRLPTPLLAAADALMLDDASWQGTTLRFTENIALINLFDPDAAALVGRNAAVHRLLSPAPVALFSTRQP